MRRFGILALLSSLFATSLFAQIEIASITPSSGPTTGGTVVTLKGDFSGWPYGVYFGDVPAVSSERTDPTTIVAVTPPHLPGTSRIHLFDYDLIVESTASFTFEGGVPEDHLERILVPLLTPPVYGAFGSEFHTELRLGSKADGRYPQVYGLRQPCPDDIPSPEMCAWNRADRAFIVFPGSDRNPAGIEYSGQPGAFVYLSNVDAAALSGNLRVHDVSRAALNYGTEIPLVREREFQNESILLLGVPGDARFRNTLRIYGTANMRVYVTVQGQQPVELQLTGSDDLFEPSYATFSNFPTGTEPFWVRIEGPPGVGGVPPIYFGSFWAFISVTNNETQVISTITPQP
ncbi:MAG TPA: IPT/TIG domain-containing protein [Thermoanaerobaculia bacterium]|nr:IPT/TIG domain-containing protein [Thermoanaerobaculia bacterium]